MSVEPADETVEHALDLVDGCVEVGVLLLIDVAEITSEEELVLGFRSRPSRDAEEKREISVGEE